MPYLGLDLGFGNIKLFGPDGGIILPSRVAIAGGETTADMIGAAGGDAPRRIQFAGRRFYVGAEAHAWGRPVESMDLDRFAGTPEMRALTYAALTQYADLDRFGPADLGDVALYVGLPLATLTSDTADETTASVKEWLIGVHQWFVDGRHLSVNVTAVHVTSQAAGAYMDWLLTEEGKPHPASAGRMADEIGIISVGFNTLERMVLSGAKIVQRMTGGSTSGVRRLLEILNADGLWSLGELDARLRAEAIPGHELRPALETWGREVSGEIERTWGSQWRRFGHVAIVGGGAVLLNGHLLPKFRGKAVMADEPILSIARGLYKLALLQKRKGAA
jgi:hypothetical protein